MAAFPANIAAVAVVQDKQGFKANVRINLFAADLSVGGSSNIGTADLQTLVLLATQATTSIFATLQAMTNAKIVRQGLQIDFNYAQEPTTESGTYELVTQKAKLNFGDGAGGFSHIEIPAPIDGLFETTSQDDLIVINPASAALTAFRNAFNATNDVSQGALSASTFNLLNLTPRGGTYGAQFFGGQLTSGKPRRRRVLQGA